MVFKNWKFGILLIKLQFIVLDKKSYDLCFDLVLIFILVQKCLFIYLFCFFFSLILWFRFGEVWNFVFFLVLVHHDSCIKLDICLIFVWILYFIFSKLELCYIWVLYGILYLIELLVLFIFDIYFVGTLKNSWVWTFFRKCFFILLNWHFELSQIFFFQKWIEGSVPSHKYCLYCSRVSMEIESH